MRCFCAAPVLWLSALVVVMTVQASTEIGIGIGVEDAVALALGPSVPNATAFVAEAGIVFLSRDASPKITRDECIATPGGIFYWTGMPSRHLARAILERTTGDPGCLDLSSMKYCYR